MRLQAARGVSNCHETDDFEGFKLKFHFDAESALSHKALKRLSRVLYLQNLKAD
jgi:hypothetical protein